MQRGHMIGAASSVSQPYAYYPRLPAGKRRSRSERGRTMRRIEFFGPVVEPHRGQRTSAAVAATLLLVSLLPAGCEKKTEQAAAPPIDVQVVDVAQRDV